ncbi:MAG: hypothetical protein IK017_01325 [Paludibacteraceae bacterium]|nr:hypothetical protein [Paludibacteraceae bacterium]
MNRLKRLLFFLMTCTVLTTSAQDVIVKRNGDELQCKILEVSKNEVKYKRWSNLDGPIFAEKKSDIFMIKYENGEKDVMAYEVPALDTAISIPNLSFSMPNEVIVADPTPISNIYLKYKAFGSKSGIIKWGHPQTKEQAQNIFTKDWLDYKKARKNERAGKIMVFTGGPLFLGGSCWIVPYSIACKEYIDAKRNYEEIRRMYDISLEHDIYKLSYANEEKLWAADWRRTCGYLMIGGLATGTPLLIFGIIKAKRGHSNAIQIVNKHIDEYEQIQGKTSMSKPEFNIDSYGNNIVFSLTF